MNVHSEEVKSMDSAPPSSNAENLAETRQGQILNAAAQVFAKKGYQRATVKEIAALAGVAPGTIYLYFKSKRDLLLAIADQLIGQAWEQTQAQIAHTDAGSYIAAVLENTLHFVRQNRSLIQALMTEIWTDDLLQGWFFDQILNPIFQTGASYLEANVAMGNARSCQVEIVVPTIAGSLIILSTLRGLATDQFLAEYSDDDLVKELTCLYLYGLRPTSEGLSA
jgi:AcrR family transcriptional regulator